MRRLARPLLLTALATCCGAAFAATADQAPQGRLPGWAVPQSYQLAFKVDPAQQDFSGTTTIKVKLTQASDHLWLDGAGLKVSKVTVTDAAGKAHAGKYVAVDPKAGVARVDFGRTLKPQQLTVKVEYTAPLNQQLQGLYKVTAKGQPYAMTQMEPISARFAFPGFDEPGFKTPFDLSITVPDHENVVANTQQVREQPAGRGWKTVTFAQTLPLPTYLVAFAVGPWDIVAGPDISPTAYRVKPLQLRGIAAKGEGQRMQHVLGETPSIIHALENYYGFGYPFDKLDLLAAPDFEAGAMENPGLVTFRDWLLLIDKDSPARNVRGSFNVNAHELAHQWTGDTVTTEWWNDIWLNEAFATWMQQKVTMQVHPEYRADLDRVRGGQGAMNNDSLVSARSIRQPITGNGDIMTAFDGITYQKGASVIGMFENYVGEPTYQKGMRAYIQSQKYGNATADDLVSAIATAADKGDAFKHAFKSFLDQSGVPYVATKLEQKNGQAVLQLSQSRYLPLGSSGDPQRIWGVPVCVRYGTAASGKDGAPSSKVACKMLDKATGSMVLAGASQPTWIMPNANASGYYRFSLDKSELGGLVKQIGKLSDAEQLAYADAIGASFRHGDIDAGDMLAALQPLAGSKIREVATVPLDQAAQLYHRIAANNAQRARLAEWAKAAYLPRLEQLGYQRKANEPEDDALMRSSLAGALAFDFKLPQVRAALLKQGEAALKPGADGRLNLAAADPDLLGDALGVAVQEHGKSVVDALIAELPKTSDPALRNGILGGLASVEDPALAEQVRNFALTKPVKVGEMGMLLRGGRDTLAQRDAMWTWFTGHYQQILDRTGSFSGGRLPSLAAGGGCSSAEYDRLQAFFKTREKDAAGIGRGLAQTGESIQLCGALKAKQDPAAILR
ncbi:M1 family metallopeptidase [Rhodanobacter denitrificans]|uniref:Aminopeptidase n=1 Tax=Rhodanobacter denitrificans TaxID=666685 RepID=M4NBD7_9GAMM|nr:M1 family metallopeptidase [Rhodanobacter denitrificans]AGG87909.1 aminopeptidase N [Rhodanobacter denitrificans]UJM87066.1 M1 family metallopeptidase [Rhodanobacter denitrificans]